MIRDVYAWGSGLVTGGRRFALVPGTSLVRGGTTLPRQKVRRELTVSAHRQHTAVLLGGTSGWFAACVQNSLYLKIPKHSMLLDS
jgi:hypothetical protein